MKRSSFYCMLFMLIALLLSGGCAKKGLYTINLLPTPDIYASGLVDPFSNVNPSEKLPYKGILYATDRIPATEKDEERFYTSRLGVCLRLGQGHVTVDGKLMTWDEARRISLQEKRKDEYPLVVTGIREIGILDRSYNIFMDPSLKQAEPEKPGREFAEMINRKLAVSKNKNIIIYTHGYNTNFEDPLLVGSEFWHYLGYDGVFIAYSWPATEKGTAYLGDTEKAKWASRNFRLFLQYLSDMTDVENIHIIAYSMGTRVASLALEELTLIHMGKAREEVQKKIHIGNVLLVSSDLTVDLIANYINDGLLNVLQSLTIYSSDSDKALGFSRWLFETRRIGQITHLVDMSEPVKDFLNREKNIMLVDATKAAKVDEGNGHHYFQSSPWVSSDILMLLMYDLPPEKRGLVQNDSYIWEFPKDHIEQLKKSIARENAKSSE